MDSMSYAISEVRALVRRPSRDQAQQLLQRIAEQVLPVLCKRRFRVRRLQEFFPKDPNLLGMNVNRGYTIYIRLRPHSDPSAFFPYEALLETMLHELTHMVHGPHNQDFYRYLDQLKEEMESLMLRGLVGREGAAFQDAGVGLSLQTEASAIQVRYANDNRAAVLAAQRRARYQQLLGGVASRRLGGSSQADAGLTPQQLRVRVLEAAERRRRDNQACSTSAAPVANAVTVLGIDDSSDEEEEGDHERRAAATVGSAVVDLVDDSDDDDHVVDLTSD